jgi:23S rRNA (adenine2030-N6)-methyltransferase
LLSPLNPQGPPGLLRPPVSTDPRGSPDPSDLSAPSDAPDASHASDASDAPGPPAAVRDYLQLVASFNEPGRLRYYPGSAAVAQSMLRPQDHAVLLEAHPQEVAALKRWVGRQRQIGVHARDCYEGLPALLPPPIKRGMVLIDPSYEIKSEYRDIVALLHKALQRWPNGVYLLWYPLLQDERHRQLLRTLSAAPMPATLIDEFRFSNETADLYGSGLAIVNMPWKSDEVLAGAMRYVIDALNPDGTASHKQRWLS